MKIVKHFFLEIPTKITTHSPRTHSLLNRSSPSFSVCKFDTKILFPTRNSDEKSTGGHALSAGHVDGNLKRTCFRTDSQAVRFRRTEPNADVYAEGKPATDRVLGVGGRELEYRRGRDGARRGGSSPW